MNKINNDVASKMVVKVAATVAALENFEEKTRSDDREWQRTVSEGDYTIYIGITAYDDDETNFMLEIRNDLNEKWYRLVISASYDAEGFINWCSMHQGEIAHPMIEKYRPELGRVVKSFAEILKSPLVEIKHAQYNAQQLIEAAIWLLSLEERSYREKAPSWGYQE